MLSWLFVVGIFGSAVFGVPSPQNLSITIQQDGSLKIARSLDARADVEAIYIDAMNATGWDTLEVKINVIKRSYTVTDNQRMFAAGVAEGYLTSKGIYQLYTNIQDTSFWNFTDGPPANLQKFMNEQAEYMDQAINANGNVPFWQYADLLREQT